MLRIHAHLAFPLMLFSAGVVSAQAGAIDYARTAGGSTTPASTRVTDSVVPWELFDQPLAASVPTSMRYVFSEPGLGNAIGQPRGQLLTYRHLGDRQTRIIMDILAWVPVAQLLYLDPHVPMGSDPVMLTRGAGFVPVNLTGDGPVRWGSSRGSRSLAGILMPNLPGQPPIDPNTPGESSGSGSGGSNPGGNQQGGVGGGGGSNSGGAMPGGGGPGWAGGSGAGGSGGGLPPSGPLPNESVIPEPGTMGLLLLGSALLLRRRQAR